MANININKGWMTRIDGSSVVNKMTYVQLLNQIREIRYEEFYSSIGGDSARDESVERGPFPHFVKVFYALFTERGRVPTPEEVFEAYKHIHCEDLGNGYGRLESGYVFNFNALCGRITRAYCSWCRELTLLYALFEVLPFGFVPYYDIEKDMKGVDIVIVHGKHKYNIHSYLRSKKSMQYRNEKNHRYDREQGHHIEVVASNFNTERVGDINVHGVTNATWLLQQMQDIEKQVG